MSLYLYAVLNAYIALGILTFVIVILACLDRGVRGARIGLVVMMAPVAAMFWPAFWWYAATYNPEGTDQ